MDYTEFAIVAPEKSFSSRERVTALVKDLANRWGGAVEESLFFAAHNITDSPYLPGLRSPLHAKKCWENGVMGLPFGEAVV